MSDQFGAVGGTVAHRDQASCAQTWFAAGERISYDPKARAIVAGGDAPLRLFLRQEGDPAQAISFLPGFPDGSFGWAKVRPHLPNAGEMPKLFLDYLGMGAALCGCPENRPGRPFVRRIAHGAISRT